MPEDRSLSNFWNLFQQKDPNDPMAAFAQQPPGTAEMLFKLASAMGPMAPFIGGHRTPLGRMLGATAVLGGGASDIMADMLKAQRTDPQAQLLRQAQAIQTMGTHPSYPAIPEQTGLVQGPLLESGAFDSSGGQRPTGIIPPTPPGPNKFDFNSLPLAMQISPAGKDWLDRQTKQSQIDTSKEHLRLLERQINQPIKIGQDEKLVNPTTYETIVEAPPSPTRQLAELNLKEKQKQDQLGAEFVKRVAARAATQPKDKNGRPLSTPEIANLEMDSDLGRWGDLAGTHPLAKEASDYRAEERRIAQSQRNFDQQMRMERQRDADQQTRWNIQQGELPAVGLFADKENGIIRQVTKNELRKNPENFIRKSPQAQQDVDLLSNAFPNIARMRELSAKLLAQNPGQQLQSVIANGLKHKGGVDPDVQELYDRGVSLNAEISRSQGGGSRVLGQIYNATKGEAVPGITVTNEVAQRMYDTAENEIQNRINSHLGLPLKKMETKGPPQAPGNNQEFRLPKPGEVSNGIRTAGEDPAVRKYLDSLDEKK